MKNEVMIDKLLLRPASGGQKGERGITICSLIRESTSKPTLNIYRFTHTQYIHKTWSFFLLIKVSSQFQQIELYPPHTSHCLYGVMLFIIFLRGPKCLFLFQGMKCTFIRVLPTPSMMSSSCIGNCDARKSKAHKLDESGFDLTLRDRLYQDVLCCFFCFFLIFACLLVLPGILHWSTLPLVELQFFSKAHLYTS